VEQFDDIKEMKRDDKTCILDVKFLIPPPPPRVLEDYSVPRSTAAKLGTILFILRQENLVQIIKEQ